jgi:glycosyltransferase involved in cell wall biosynthesis
MPTRYRFAMHDAAPPLPVDGFELSLNDRLPGERGPLVSWLVAPLDPAPGDPHPPRRFWTLARELASRGHEVVWWTCGFDHASLRRRQPPASLEGMESFQLRTLGVPDYGTRLGRRRFASQRAFADRLEREALAGVADGRLARPDLILSTLPPLESSESSMRLAAQLDAAFVVDLLGDWPDCEVASAAGPVWLKRLLFAFASASLRGCSLDALRLRRGHVLEAADALVAPAGSIVAAATERGDAIILPLGAFPQEFSPCRRPAAESAGEPVADHAHTPAGSIRRGDRFTLLVRIDPLTEADASCLVEAIGQLSGLDRPLRLMAIGDGPARGPLERLAGGQGASAACHLVRSAAPSRSDWLALLAGCDAAIAFGPVHEPQAIPGETCECLAAGLPLIVAADDQGQGQLATLIEGFGAGVPFRRHDPSSLAAAVRGLVEEPARLALAAAAARRLAEAELDLERICVRYADWLESLR